MDGLTRWRLASRYISNWYIIAPLLRAVVPDFHPLRGGLRGRRLGRLEVTLRLRNGYRLRCRLDELEGIYAPLIHHEYDVPGLDLAKARTIIDVGANVGGASLWFAWQAPLARIIAVEPDPETADRLSRNIDDSDISDRVSVSRKALTAASGTVYLERDPWSVATRVATAADRGTLAVDSISLADLLEQSGADQVDLLKLDCEGAEGEILLSSDAATLRRFRAIVAECHIGNGHRTEDLAAHLEGLGFTVTMVLRQPSDHDMLTAVLP
jgi:FkbM family methyltransferase